MGKGNSIYKEAVRFWENHLLNALPAAPIDWVEQDIQKRLSSIYLVGDMYHFLFDIKNVRFVFLSPSIEKILGITDQTTVQDMLDRLHPDDHKYFLAFEQKFAETLLELPVEKRGKYKCRYDVRYKHKDGHYVRILHQLVVVQQDENGVPLQSLAVHQDITHLKPSGKPTLSFIGLDDEPSFFDVKVDLPIHRQKKVITKRETEILRMIAQGSTSQDIARELNISRHTVDSHRKNLLRKSYSSNTLELISKSIAEGWL